MDYSSHISAICAQLGIEQPQAEYVFAPPRRWRFDFAWRDRMIALEIEGGVWSRGRHTRGRGYLRDMEKYNEAAVLGWRVLRFTPQQLAQRKPVIQVLSRLLQQQTH